MMRKPETLKWRDDDAAFRAGYYLAVEGTAVEEGTQTYVYDGPNHRYNVHARVPSLGGTWHGVRWAESCSVQGAWR